MSDFIAVAKGWERMFPRVRFLILDLSIQFCDNWGLRHRPNIRKETARILARLQRTLGNIKNLQKLELISTAAGRTLAMPDISDRIYEGLVKMLVSNSPNLQYLHLSPCYSFWLEAVADVKCLQSLSTIRGPRGPRDRDPLCKGGPGRVRKALMQSKHQSHSSRNPGPLCQLRRKPHRFRLCPFSTPKIT